MKLLYFIVLTGLCMACHQPQVYRINGSLPGALDGYVVKLYNIDTYPDVLLDSTVIKDEKFQLEGTRTFEYPKYCRLVVDMTPDEPDQRKKTLKAYRFFADNTAMEFQCQMDSMPAYYWEAVNKEHNVTLTGSPTQDLYQAYKTSVQELSERYTALRNEYLEVYHVPALDGILNTEKGMKIVREMNMLKAQLNKAAFEFIKAHNNSVVSLLLANNLLNSTRSEMTVEEIDGLMNGFTPALQNASMMGDVKKTAERMRCVARGGTYHDIVLKNLKGENVPLSEYMKPGAYNMFEFWASWCSPCRGEIPHLRHLYEVCGKDFNMISVSIDERDTDWKKAVQEEGMQWHQLCDQKGRKGPVAIEYQVSGVPYCIVLDPEGKIVCGGVRGAELDVVVQDLLGEKAKGL